jgi:hypothetical protein
MRHTLLLVSINTFYYVCATLQELGLESAALGGSGGGSVVAGIVDELVKEGAVAGVIVHLDFHSVMLV